MAEEKLDFRTLPKLSKGYILERITQESIFAFYLHKVDANINIYTIKDCIVNNAVIKSPLRIDNNPTVGFRYSGYKLRYKDFNGHFWGDCFDLVMKLYDIDFFKSLELVAKDFSLHKYDTNNPDKIEVLREFNFNFGEVDLSKIKREKSVIVFTPRSWDKRDAEFWRPIHLTRGELESNYVFPIEVAEVNGLKSYEDYGDRNICYAYYFGRDENKIQNIQLYFPYKRKTRFITNYYGIPFLKQSVPERIAVITKSNKDRLAINTIAEKECISLRAFAVIPEGYLIAKEEYDSLWNNYEYLTTLMDFDFTGRGTAWRYRNTYNIPSLFFTNGSLKTTNYGSKDFTDYLRINGIEKTVKLMKQAEDYILFKYNKIRGNE